MDEKNNIDESKSANQLAEIGSKSRVLAVCRYYLWISAAVAVLTLLTMLLSFFTCKINVIDNMATYMGFYSLPLFFLGIVFGVISLVYAFFKKTLTYNISIMTIIISASLFIIVSMLSTGLYEHKREEYSVSKLACSILKNLQADLIENSKKNRGILPSADIWSQGLIDKYGGGIILLKTPECDECVSCYAFNKNLSNMKLDNVPSDTVLLFQVCGDKLNMSGDEELFKRSHPQKESYIILINGDFIECRQKNNELIYLKDGKKIDGLRWNPNK